ncbi:MAG: mechanosensitive ion channel [Crocinitomicaceae bacterium]|nr:mechanosensitive ion channel [Crocinitomicaceae bacterium]
MGDLEYLVTKTTNFINKYTYDLLIHWGLNDKITIYVNLVILLLVIASAVVVIHFITRRVIRQVLTWIARGKQHYSIYLKENKFAYYLALVAPVSLIKFSISIVFENFQGLIKPLHVLLDIYIVFMVVNILMSICNAIGDRMKTNEKFKYRPIESYLQVIRIILTLFGAIAVFSQLTGKDPVAFFSIMGAASAVLLLMFKDTIMGFVASIQVTVNDMVRIGDWIEMPKYGADGDVIDINLTTVKVQNWDKTITTVPTHTLISDSFKNWRGMVEFEGRRCKRSIIIKQGSIRYVEDSELEKFKQIQGITQYIDEKKAEIDLHNANINANRTLLLNGRNITNAGLFRKYSTWYIENHPGVHKDKTMMVRQLAPTTSGLPFEFYFFTNTVAWLEYEAIVGDIFDHLLAAVKYFDLEIFEDPSSSDVKNIGLLHAPFPLEKQDLKSDK